MSEPFPVCDYCLEAHAPDDTVTCCARGRVLLKERAAEVRRLRAVAVACATALRALDADLSADEGEPLLLSQARVALSVARDAGVIP